MRKGLAGCTKSPCKMAGRWGRLGEQHFPLCIACNNPLPSPPPARTHTHTNNSLTFTRLPDGDSAPKIRKTPLIKDNTGAAAGGGGDMGRETVQDGIYISPTAGKKVTLKDNMGGLVERGYK